MKRLVLTGLSLVLAILSYGQSVYMHEAQEEAERNGSHPIDVIVGLLIIIGIIYIIRKIRPSKHSSVTNLEADSYKYYSDDLDWEERERKEHEDELKILDYESEEEEIIGFNNMDASPIKITSKYNTKHDIIEPIITTDIRQKEQNANRYSIEDLSIKTLASPIDLGLSVLWADCNIGASAPEDYGRYIKWGITVPCEKWEYNKPIHSLSVANIDKLRLITGNEDGNISANKEYDVATINMGEGWRIPRKEEIEELVSKCSWERIERNGIKGIKMIGPNGNDIFLPCAGRWIVENAAFVGDEVEIWSATPYTGPVVNSRYNVAKSLFAYYLQISNKSINGDGPIISTVHRDLAISIRAVKDK